MDVRKLFSRRSAAKEDDATQENFAAKFRRRSRSRPRQSQAASSSQQDPLTSAYTQPTRHITLSNGPAPERQLPQSHPNDTQLAGRNASLPAQSGSPVSPHRQHSIGAHTSSAPPPSPRYDEELASSNAAHKEEPPPVPPIPHSASEGFPTTGQSSPPAHPQVFSDALEKAPDALSSPPGKVEEIKKSNPIASEFSSASYYARYNSPPPSFGHYPSAGPSSLDKAIQPQDASKEQVRSTAPTVDFNISYESLFATPLTSPSQGKSALGEDPIMVGDTAAAGARNFPTLKNASPSSEHSNGSAGATQTLPQKQQTSLPLRERSPQTSKTNPANEPSSLHSPTASSTANDTSLNVEQALNQDTKSTKHNEAERRERGSLYDRKSLLVENAAEAPSLEGIVDLNNTSKTTVDTKYEPAVYHDTVRPEVHHVRHDRTSREIHNHEIRYRVLPVKEVQVLPAKHYAPLGPNGELVEIDESQIPRHSDREFDWSTNESDNLVRAQDILGDRGERTAERAGGDKRESRKYVNDDGIPTTETTWVHEPMIDMGPKPQQPNQEDTNRRHQHSSSLRGDSGESSTGLASTLRQGHEQRAEAAVAANAARQRVASESQTGSRSVTTQAHEKPRANQERAAAVLAAQRAAGRAP